MKDETKKLVVAISGKTVRDFALVLVVVGVLIGNWQYIAGGLANIIVGNIIHELGE